MGIIFNSREMTFKLDTRTTSYILKVHDCGYLLCLYYGASVPETDAWRFYGRPCSFSPEPKEMASSRYFISPDSAPLEYSGFCSGDYRQSAFTVRNARGDSVTDLRYASYEIIDKKESLPGLPCSFATDTDSVKTLKINLLDALTGCIVTLSYSVFEDYDVITRSVSVKNNSDKPFHIEKIMSLSTDLKSMDYDVITLWGRHDCERHVDRRPLCHGVTSVSSTKGASGHNYNPFLCVCSSGANEEYGEAYGFNLVYSGNFTAQTECDFNKTTRVMLGINPEGFSWLLEPGESFFSPECVCVYSNEGLGSMSRKFHRFYNDRLIRWSRKNEHRPLLLNSWEGMYFDITEEKILRLAADAGDIGAELLVMDDGWFGSRDDDSTSLGDWFFNKRKFPHGLEYLADSVHNLGLKFGIWFEPEMVSPRSVLLDEHPDYHIHIDGREPMLNRRQYILDMTREDVRENVFNQLSAILSTGKIDYVKWDFNRNITDAGSAWLSYERGGEFYHRFMLGSYELIDRVTSTFPDILFEGCSGGGGRFDPGMLHYFPQYWCSDNTDPIERLYIQFGTSLCYPASAVGAHVSASNRTGYETKANVALWGTFGYELDPARLTENERQEIKEQIRLYDKYYDLTHNGELYRLISPFENDFKASWMLVSPDKSRAMVTYVTTREVHNDYFVLRLRGLDSGKIYEIEETGEEYSGAFLMNAGLNLTGIAFRDGESIRYTLNAKC